MPDNNDTKPITQEEFKKITEEVYKRNLELAKLYKEVDSLNRQREGLVHLINHKVKGAFTHSKYIFAGMLDGTFGELNEKIKKIAQQGLDSDDAGIKTIDLVLNASNMRKGTVKYEMKTVDLKEMILKTISGKMGMIEPKGLKIENKIKEDTYNILGDPFWLKEVVNNLIENSIRYTPNGKITIGLEKKESTIIFSIKDEGIGITDEDKKNLFTEGGRGKDSLRVNVDSTGYGLYSVKLIMDAHKGKVWAESEGPGKGSAFYVELPMVA